MKNQKASKNEKGKGKTLKSYLKDIKPVKPIRYENLTLVPLRGQGHGQLSYELGSQAIKDGIVEVKEVDEAGSVPELMVVNKSDTMILFVDGEELIGAKQNRILNTSIMIDAHSKTVIPVSCVEEGRWHSRSSKFNVGSFAPTKLRARKIKDVTMNLASVGVARSDQGRVWDSVAKYISAAKIHSPTMAMHDVVDHNRKLLNEYIKTLPCPKDACGVMIVIDGKFEAMDLFDKAETLESLWPRLIKGYAMDAIIRKVDNADQIKEKKSKTNSFSEKAAKILLEHIGELSCQTYYSAGIGEDWRFQADDIIGQALIVKKVCVHLSAFPNDGNENRDSNDLGSTYIAPPSRRRNHWDGYFI